MFGAKADGFFYRLPILENNKGRSCGNFICFSSFRIFKYIQLSNFYPFLKFFGYLLNQELKKQGFIQKQMKLLLSFSNQAEFFIRNIKIFLDKLYNCTISFLYSCTTVQYHSCTVVQQTKELYDGQDSQASLISFIGGNHVLEPNQYFKDIFVQDNCL